MFHKTNCVWSSFFQIEIYIWKLKVTHGESIGYSRRNQTLRENMKKTQILIFFSGLGKLEHELIYWFTTIKSQMAKKQFKETRKKQYLLLLRQMVKKYQWVTTMKMINSLKDLFWQIATINIFLTDSIFHPKLVFSQIICNCLKQLADSPWVTKRTT